MPETKNESDGWFGSWKILVQRVMTDQETPVDRATGTAKLIAELDPSLRPAFLKWFTSGEVDLNLAVAGYSIGNILERQGALIGISGAFTYLDGLIKKPEETRMLLEFKYNLHVWGDEEWLTRQKH